MAASSERAALPLSGERSTPTALSLESALASSACVEVRIALTRRSASGSS
jgi:hypothetical protein